MHLPPEQIDHDEVLFKTILDDFPAVVAALQDGLDRQSPAA